MGTRYCIDLFRAQAANHRLLAAAYSPIFFEHTIELAAAKALEAAADRLERDLWSYKMKVWIKKHLSIHDPVV